MKGAIFKILILLGIVHLIKLFLYDIPIIIPAVVSGYMLYKTSWKFYTFTPRTQKLMKSMTIVNGPLVWIVDFITNENHWKKYDSMSKKIVHKPAEDWTFKSSEEF